jgi:diguanylate cyclase (GGDEF)-like protein
MSPGLRHQPGTADSQKRPLWLSVVAPPARERDAGAKIPQNEGPAEKGAPAAKPAAVLTIRASILGGLALMVLFTAAIGYFSLRTIRQSAVLVVEIYDRSLMSIDYARAAGADFGGMQAGFLRRRMITDPVLRAAAVAHCGELADAFFEDLGISAERSQSARARAAAERVRIAARGWLDSQEAIGEPMPAPEVLARLDSFSATVDHQLDLLINLTAGDGFLYRQQALRSIAIQTRVAIGFTLSALLFSGLITWFLNRRISGPIAAASAIAVRIAYGDLNVAIPTGRRDELGSLLRSMASMRDSIGRMMAAEVSQRRSAQARLMDAIHSTQEGVVLLDGVGRVVVTNDPIQAFFGPVDERMPPSFSIADLLRNLARSRLSEEARLAVGAQAYATDDDRPGAMDLPLADGRFLRVSWCRTGEGGLVAFFSDVSQSRQREALLAQTNLWFDSALTNMSQGLCVFDSTPGLKVFNSRLCEIYRLPRTALMPGMTFAEVFALLHAGAPSRLPSLGRAAAGQAPDMKALEAAIAGRTMLEHLQLLGDGRVIAISHRPISDGGSVLTFEDVTERQRSEARISFLARHDALTSLPNRMLFTERLDEALAGLGSGQDFNLLLIDLDRFKEVNDTHGHPVGDRLLRVVADRLLGCSRRHDTVARLGGDEFAIIQAAADGSAELASEELARRVIASIGKPFAIDGAWLDIGGSVGIVNAPAHGKEAETLMRCADIALYSAKEAGRNDLRLFTPRMDEARQQRRQLEAELLLSLSEGQMELFYQPIVSLRSLALTGFEALLRWHHPTRGLMMPGDFIGLAEETDFIERLGSWIMLQACTDAALWPEHLRLAINVSPVQFRSGKLVLFLGECLRRSGVAAHRLDLEITETALLHENEATRGMLRDMHAMGAKIVLDDFGTGFSSLSYLRSFPFDRIKIDRSFVMDLGQRRDSGAIVRAILALGASLGMPVTAEGVETDEQRETLRAAGCDEAQGYLFSRPAHAGSLERLIADWDAAIKPYA